MPALTSRFLYISLNRTISFVEARRAPVARELLQFGAEDYMRFPANVRALTLAGCAALIPSFSAPAQVSLQFHFGEDDYHRIDSRHPLQGRQYQTMGSLAHTLDEIAQDLNREAYRGARASHGDRSQVRLLASVSDFARRTSDFHQRMDSYLDSPWDIKREVDDVTRRARDVNQRIVRARLFPGTYDLWNSAIDVLGRMQQVLRGTDVQLPPPYVPYGGHGGHGDWDHSERDRNGNGIPDRLEVIPVQPVPPPLPSDPRYDRDRGVPRPTNVSELRRLGRELDERVTGTRDSMPRGDRDARTESFDRFSTETRRLRQTIETENFDPRDLKQTVSRLLEDARRTGDVTRNERSFRGDQDAWQRITDILSRMRDLL